MSDVGTQFYTRSKESWDVMLEDLARAQKSIDFEQYIFTIDAIGKKFLNLFIEKARAGLKVRILCDMVGSYTFYRSPLATMLKSHGVDVRFFNPISPWRIANFTSNFFRDHRKIMIIDNNVAHIGSVCIQEDMADWRDTHMRITGPIVQDIKTNFESIWSNVKKKLLFSFKKPEIFTKKFNLVTNAPGFRQRNIYYELIATIRNARRYIYLTTPYFIPDRRLFRVLRLAAKRGVDVRLLIPELSDHLFINHARESYFTMCLASGIRVFLYKGEMLHAKTTVVDDTWASVGSFNLDSLSSVFNHEANISSSDPHFIKTVRDQFEIDIRHGEEVLLERWIRRPFLKKILEVLTWPFHGVM